MTYDASRLLRRSRILCGRTTKPSCRRLRRLPVIHPDARAAVSLSAWSGVRDSADVRRNAPRLEQRLRPRREYNTRRTKQAARTPQFPPTPSRYQRGRANRPSYSPSVRGLRKDLRLVQAGDANPGPTKRGTATCRRWLPAPSAPPWYKESQERASESPKAVEHQVRRRHQGCVTAPLVRRSGAGRPTGRATVG